MSRPAKILLVLATVAPLVSYALITVVFVAVTLRFQASTSTAPPPEVLLVMAAHGLNLLWVLGLIAFYIANVFKNPRIAPDYKALWAVVIFLGNVSAMPVYWYQYIWREPEPGTAVSQNTGTTAPMGG